MFNLNYVVGHLLRFGEDAWILNNDIKGKRAIIDLIVQKDEIKGDVSILITLGMEKGQHGTDQLLVRDCLHPVLLVCFSFPQTCTNHVTSDDVTSDEGKGSNEGPVTCKHIMKQKKWGNTFWRKADEE